MGGSMNTAIDAAIEPPQSDADLERRIECARICMVEAKDEISRRDHLRRMESLIAQRSDEQKARLESRLPGLWRS
jgi:hypothetical protein